MHAAKRKVTLFTRNYLVPDIVKAFSGLKFDYTISYLTDGKSDLADDTRKVFYASYKARMVSTTFDGETLDDIINRCRMLREINKEEALRRVHAMTISVLASLDQLKPDIVVSQMVDEYVTDILYRLCIKKNISYACFCPSFFAGKLFVSRRPNGWPMVLREPDGNEIRSVADLVMEKTYRANFKQNNRFDYYGHLRGVAKAWAKRVIFPIKGFLERDPLNIHYVITPYLGERRNPFRYNSAHNFDVNWKDKIEALNSKQNLPLVYFPLGFVPESTNNYWVKSSRVLDYDAFILEAIKNLSNENIVIVKEHIHMLGIRSSDLYKKLAKVKNVVLVPPSEFGKEVMEHSDIVVMGAGSSAVEATLLNKPVLTYCKHTYWLEAANATWIDADDLSDISKRLKQALKKFKSKDKDAIEQFLKTCLSSTFRSSGPGRVWPIIHQDDAKQLLEILSVSPNEERFA